MIGRTRDFWDKVAPIQTELNAYNKIQEQIHLYHEKWDYTMKSHVHTVLTSIVETVLSGWSITDLEGNSNGVSLLMPQPKVDESKEPITNDMKTLTGGSLGFGPIHNGRIAILIQYPRTKNEIKAFNMLDVVNPATLTSEAISKYVALFIGHLAEWSKKDRVDAEERDNKDWR